VGVHRKGETGGGGKLPGGVWVFVEGRAHVVECCCACISARNGR
jgi:hypothetical protein